MRGAMTTMAVFALGLGVVVPARAGVYSTDEIYPWPLPRNFREFRLVHGGLAAASSDRYYRAASAWLLTTADIDPQGGPVPLRLLAALPPTLQYLERPNQGLQFLQRVTALEAKERGLGLTTEDRINLSAYLLYLGQPDRAVRALLPAATPEKPHFMVLANLATAYEMAQIPERALDYRQQALAAWPGTWPGWGSDQLNWYRKVETYHLNLLRHRAPEMARASRGAEHLDSLFPRLRFVGPSGEFEVGTIAPDQWGEVPPDAIAVVTQLVLWLPNDNRLLWMLGELLNAQGDVLSALAVFTDLVKNRNYTAPRELMRHYRELMEARDLAELLAGDGNRSLLRAALWVMTPRGAGLAPPGAGPLAQESAWLAQLQAVPGQGQQPSATNAGTAGPGAPPPVWLPDWKHIAVGFAAGLIVAPLVIMQWRELRRRRQAVEPAPRG